MPAILLAVTGTDPQPWAEALRALAPRRDIRLWPDGVGEGPAAVPECSVDEEAGGRQLLGGDEQGMLGGAADGGGCRVVGPAGCAPPA